MSKLPKSSKPRDVARRLKELGCTGPHKGRTDHPHYMANGDRVASFPNPHSGDRDVGQGWLKTMLDRLDISVDRYLGIKSKKEGDDGDAAQGDSVDRLPQDEGDDD